jgi:hypothetical protein
MSGEFVAFSFAKKHIQKSICSNSWLVQPERGLEQARNGRLYSTFQIILTMLEQQFPGFGQKHGIMKAATVK